jgi:uncharacterized protein
MSSRRNSILSACLLAILTASIVCPSSARAGLDEAKAAYLRKDYVTAAKELRPLAEKGNVRAQTTLGWMYSEGLGVEKDYKEAMKWLLKAAAVDGSPDAAKAQHNLGVMYENGLGVAIDSTRSAYWYQKGAQNGDASAQCNLGTLYLEGKGVERNYSQAVQWLTKAAEQGDTEAYANLGKVYFEGLGVQKNWALSYFFLYMAANYGERESPQAKQGLSLLLPRISPTQLDEGKRLVNEALSKH